MSNVNVLVQLDINPEKMQEVAGILREFQRSTEAEEGLIYMHVLQNTDNPTQVFFVERWESEEKFTLHINAPHFVDFGESMHGKASLLIHQLEPM